MCVFVVLYCTLLARAEAGDERSQLEAKMQSDPALLPILQALTDIRAEDLVEVSCALFGMDVESDFDCLYVYLPCCHDIFPGRSCLTLAALLLLFTCVELPAHVFPFLLGIVYFCVPGGA